MRFLMVFFAFAAVAAANHRDCAAEGPVSFEFSDSNSTRDWQIVNDGVMGGKSSSRVDVTSEGHLRFRGNLSLENNGGFASVRLRPRTLNVKPGQTVALRVRGDGRTYNFNLYTADRRTAYSFQQKFKTTAGQWVEVELPLSGFVAHSFGRPRRQDVLDPSRITSLGILLGDKKPGSFETRVDWIRFK